jgi:hypothetical protein
LDHLYPSVVRPLPPLPMVHHLVVRVTVESPKGGIDWPAWLTAGATIFLALGVLLAARQLQEGRVARLTEAAAEVSRRWEGDELIQARDAIDHFTDAVQLRDGVLQALRGDPDDPAAAKDYNVLLREPDFFDDLGAQELLGGISLRWIELTMKDIVLSRWDLWELTVQGLTEIDGFSSYANFERLAKKIKGQDLGRWAKLKRRLATAALKVLDD